MESIAMEYSNMFGKELNIQQENRLDSCLNGVKKTEIQKRKE